MKKKLLILFVFVFFIFLSCYNPPGKPKENYKNLKKVKIGMTMKEVKAIMGNPIDITIEPVREDTYWFRYTSPSGMSDNFFIYTFFF